MSTKKTEDPVMYGISRIDCETNRIRAWRVSLRRRCKRHVKNFTDRKYDGKASALEAAKLYRDELVAKYPPLSRKEFSTAKRRNNRTGITGVCRYKKSYELKDGTIRHLWYWEAVWPTKPGETQTVVFSVAAYGEEGARDRAIEAREKGLRAVNGYYWASARGAKKPANA